MEEILSVAGISEVVSDLKTLVKEYPDKAGELLEKQGRELRKEVVRNVEQRLGTAGSRHSLHKAGTYRVSKAKGTGIRQYVEVSANSPHFHLLERGHEVVLGGERRGFYPGQHMMADAVRTEGRKMPQKAGEMVDALLKERGLI